MLSIQLITGVIVNIICIFCLDLFDDFAFEITIYEYRSQIDKMSCNRLM